MNYYADVILPLPLKGTFTYHITKKQKESLDIGFRVAVSFGKRKVYTGIIKKVHNTKPELYETKPIEFIYDEEALVTELQIDFWSWISRYYFTPIGDVLKAAIPSTFLLESDTVIIKKEVDKNTIEQMSGDEFLIYEALDFKNLKINEVSDIVDKKNTYTIIQKMILKDLVELNFEINEKYKPKLVSVVYVNKEFTDNMSNNDFLEKLHQSPKQKEILLQIISKINLKKYIAVKDLKKTLNFSDSSLKSLQEKGFILIKKVKIDRITYDDNYSLKINDLSENQKKVLNQIQNQ